MNKAENKAKGEETQAKGTQAKDTNKNEASAPKNDASGKKLDHEHQVILAKAAELSKQLIEMANPNNGFSVVIIAQVDDGKHTASIIASGAARSKLPSLFADAFGEQEELFQAASLATMMVRFKKLLRK